MTVLLFDIRSITDLHTMLKKHGDWMDLGGADEQKPAKEGTVEAWGRSEKNPVSGWYDLEKGLRGRFGVYPPPLLEALGMAELTHEARGTGCEPNNRLVWCRSHPELRLHVGPLFVYAMELLFDHKGSIASSVPGE